MRRLYFILSIPVLALLLTGCTGNAIAQANEVAPTTTS